MDNNRDFHGKAILIAKNISTKKSSHEDALGIQKMKLGFFDTTAKPSTRKYHLEFMTMNGPISFIVSSTIYFTIKIDSLGFLDYRNCNFHDFQFIKIATSDDVKSLGW
ncbi:MAG: hypothetical protein WC509_05675 [Candidatus Izemoplasmatales bacterium]